MFRVNKLRDIDGCRQTRSIRRVSPQTLTEMNYLKDLLKKESTLWNFHVCDILPFVHCYKPPVSSTAATKKKVGLHLYEEDNSIRIYLMSTTSFSFPTAKDIAFNLCRENFPPGKRYEVTITLLAPASIQKLALFSFIPPPIWRLSEGRSFQSRHRGNKRGKPGHVVNASKAASSFPGPSFMIWPPSRPCCLYRRANTPAPCLYPI